MPARHRPAKNGEADSCGRMAHIVGMAVSNVKNRSRTSECVERHLWWGGCPLTRGEWGAHLSASRELVGHSYQDGHAHKRARAYIDLRSLARIPPPPDMSTRLVRREPSPACKETGRANRGQSPASTLYFLLSTFYALLST